MLYRIEIQNCLSFVAASVQLKPFTMVIGANNSGKSNFIKILTQIGSQGTIEPHHNYNSSSQYLHATRSRHDQGVHMHNSKFTIENESIWEPLSTNMRLPDGLSESAQREFIEHTTAKNLKKELYWLNAVAYQIDPDLVAQTEQSTPTPRITSKGWGVIQTLESLKLGDDEHRFDQIEQKLRQYIPEIEKLSFSQQTEGKQLQVREKHIETPIPVSKLSEGTRLLITILTILHQKNAPKIICLEDIDRGLHPRLFEQVIDLCMALTKDPDLNIQIIATTHNPYMLDLFKGKENCVVIVEKQHGESTLTTLADRLKKLPENEQPLGELWFSGAIGGVPNE